MIDANQQKYKFKKNREKNNNGDINERDDEYGNGDLAEQETDLNV